MGRFADADIAATVLRERESRRAESLRLFRATVTDVTGGLVSIQRGSDDDDEDAGYPCIVSGIPAVGDEIVAIDLGGAPLILGVLGNAATNQPRIGDVIPLSFSSSSSTAATNTSNSVYATLREITWTDDEIPDGTYDLTLNWDAQFSDTSAGSLNFRPTVNGAVDTVQTLSITAARERIGYTRSYLAQVISGGLTILIEYKRDSGSGTAAARNPRLLLLARRIGV